ncbi:uncharacterized protein ACRADG_000755 isoform 2-T2 [Cochliomyia hominivorax]
MVIDGQIPKNKDKKRKRMKSKTTVMNPKSAKMLFECKSDNVETDVVNDEGVVPGEAYAATTVKQITASNSKPQMENSFKGPRSF